MSNELSFNSLFYGDGGKAAYEAFKQGNEYLIPRESSGIITDDFSIFWTPDFTMLKLVHNKRNRIFPITNNCAYYKDDTVKFKIEFEKHIGLMFIKYLSFQAPKQESGIA
jgi:hypothetical protein